MEKHFKKKDNFRLYINGCSMWLNSCNLYYLKLAIGIYWDMGAYMYVPWYAIKVKRDTISDTYVTE